MALAPVRTVDALIHVVREFEDESIPHPDGRVDPERDLRNLDVELMLADIASIEKRMERLEKDLRKMKNPAGERELDYLKRANRSYDVLVFFGLWHPLTVHGVEIAADRTVLFPYLQLQPALRFGLWADLVRSVRAVGFFSEAERRLLHSYVGVRHACEEVVGIGVDPPPQQAYPRHQQDPHDEITDEDSDSDSDEACGLEGDSDSDGDDDGIGDDDDCDCVMDPPADPPPPPPPPPGGEVP